MSTLGTDAPGASASPLMYTIDTSVHVRALNAQEVGSDVSLTCVRQLVVHRQPLLSPTLLLVEVVAATSRAVGNPRLAWEMGQALRGLPGQLWVSLDDALAEEAARLAAEAGLRGADAVYGAVARRFGATLVTCDREQLERLRPLVSVLTPEEVVAALPSASRSGAR